jgi:HlyD family secretion protein
MRNRVGFLVGMLAALLVGGGLMASGKGRFAAFGARAPRYHLEKGRVERGDLVGRVTATGTLSAMVTVQVGSQVSGRIAELNADFGSRVKRGQVIARLDSRLFEAAVQQARANRNAAQGDLEKARAEAENAVHQLGRTTELSQNDLVAKAELDTATAKAKGNRAAVAAAQGNLEQARASYDQAKVNLGYATIISPINGIVISRNVDVGQTVAASLQAPTLFTIAEDLGKMQVHAAVSEADVGRLSAGMSASFVVDAYPDQRFGGVIHQIRDSPQTLQNVVTYDAVIDVDNPEHRLRPGMTANVTFVYAERKGVLHVPSAALRFRPPEDLLAGGVNLVPSGKHKKNKDKDHERPPGEAQAEGLSPKPKPASPAAAPGKRNVWVLHGDALAQVPIDVGVVDGNRVEVRAGELADGDVVVTDAVNKEDRAEVKAKKGLF